ncbi:MAG: ATP-dependent Clp protease ATP-binding subunit ClpX [Frisingicoccus sp.]|nr:ATP-dependent Clp protease ATP-binding subunit ClpX [Frisingicoccus sp.]
MPDYREVDEEVKDIQEIKPDTKDTEDKKEDYEEICYMCRRPESVAGKMIHLPVENICICADCMERSFTMMNNTPINYDEIMKNMNFQIFPGNMMGDGIPKSQRLKKKKAKEQKEPAFDLKQIMPPHKMKACLDDYVIGQDYAKKVMSVAVYNHYKRVATNMMDEIEIEKSNMLMIGPTGCGKTYLVRTLAKLLDVPLAIADATSLTEAGYIGDDIESVVSKLLAAADNDVEKAERGIIFIDEIDKIAKKKNTTSRDVSGESVQQGLLKLLEGSDVEVPVGASSKNAMVPLTTVNTRNILFICGGAFPELEGIIKARLTKASSIGFDAALKDAHDHDEDIMSQVTIDDLREFGMIPEFIGRLPVVFSLKGLDEDALVKILKEPKNAIIKQYQKLLALDEVDLQFDDGALEAIAHRAIQKKTGARALRSIIEELMLDIMYQIPKDDNIGRVTITKEYVENTGGPVIEMRGVYTLENKTDSNLIE